MAGVVYEFIDAVFGFYGFCLFFDCLVGCSNMTVWTPTVLGVLYACALFLALFGAIEYVSHGKAL